MKLTFEQQDVLNSTIDDIENNRHVAINAPAGTGKTVLIGEIAKRLKSKSKPFVLASTTHKAVEALQLRTSDEVSTIHSVLGLKCKIDYSTGSESFVPDGEPGIFFNDVLIIDESSMINKDLFKIILQFIKEYKIICVFVGDEKQLPPVNEIISHALIHPTPKSLTKILRHDNSICDFAGQMRIFIDNFDTINRSRIFTNEFFDKFEDIFVTSNKKEFNKLIDNFAKSSADFIFLGWTNSCVDSQMRRIRKNLGFDEDVPVEGEKIIMADTLVKNRKTIAKNNSHQKILSVKPATFCDIDCFKITTYKGFDFYSDINFNNIQKVFNSRAKTITNREGWIKFYRDKSKFCKFNFPYSQTVHRSQGSTIENVFIDFDDINRCQCNFDFLRLFYVAVTRASNKVYLLKRN